MLHQAVDETQTFALSSTPGRGSAMCWENSQYQQFSFTFWFICHPLFISQTQRASLLKTYFCLFGNEKQSDYQPVNEVYCHTLFLFLSITHSFSMKLYFQQNSSENKTAQGMLGNEKLCVWNNQQSAQRQMAWRTSDCSEHHLPTAWWLLCGMCYCNCTSLSWTLHCHLTFHFKFFFAMRNCNGYGIVHLILVF